MMQDSLPEGGLTLLDYWRIIWRFRRMIVALAVVSVLVAGITTMLSPKLYGVKATLLPIPPEPLGGGFSFGGGGGKEKGGGGGGSASLALDMLGGKSSGPSMNDFLLTLLGSRFLAERVVDQLNLLLYYGTTSKSAAINAVLGELSFNPTLYKAIEVKVLSRDPRMAADIANTYVSALDSAYKDFSITSTRRNRIFIEARLAERSLKLADTENALMAFQKENRILDPEQVGGALEMASDLHGQIVGLEVELATLREYALPSHPDINKLEAQIEELRRQLDKQESDQVRAGGVKIRKRTSLSKKVYPVFEEAPSLSFEYLRLLRQQKVEESVYGMLVGMLESTKLAEMRDVPTVRLLDAAVPPEFKTRPKTFQNVLMAGVVSIVFGILLALFLVYLEQLKAQDTTRRLRVDHGTGLAAHDPNGNGKPEDVIAPVTVKETPRALG